MTTFRTHLCVGVVLCSVATAIAADPPPGTNIAAGIAGTFGPPDAQNNPPPPVWGGSPAVAGGKMTDGLATDYPPNGTGWVGWQVPGSSPWVEIQIDLEAGHPIEGVRVHTGLKDDVWYPIPLQDWPQAILVLVSDGPDPIDEHWDWYYVDELVSRSAGDGLPRWPAAEASEYCFYGTQDGLATHGRYVKFVMAGYPYVFLDEVEVYQGTEGMLSIDRGDAVITPSTPGSRMGELVLDRKIRAGIVRRIVLDAQDVKDQVDASSIDSGTKTNLTSALNTIISNAGGSAASLTPPGALTSFDTRLPVNDPLGLHAEVFENLAAFWQALGKSGVIAWQANGENPSVWDPPALTQLPGTTAPSVAVRLMPNEYRVGAFYLSNAGETDADAIVSVDFPDIGTNPACMVMQQVEWTDTSYGGPVAAALPDAVPVDENDRTQGFRIHIPSGMTRQVWLTFHPTDNAQPLTYVFPGTHTGQILVDSQAVGQVEVRVSRLHFPLQPALSVGGFDYAHIAGSGPAGMTNDNRNKLVTHLRGHFVDTPWERVGGSEAAMPYGSLPADFSLFDAWVDRWTDTSGDSAFLPPARHFRIHMDGYPGSFNGLVPGTNDFNAAVQAWLGGWATHWGTLGLEPNQVGLLIQDEPGDTNPVDELITHWADAIRGLESTSRPLIWEDPQYADPSAGNSMLGLCDVLSPQRRLFMNGANEAPRDFYRDWVAGTADPARRLNFYSCDGPSPLLDPYAYYRLQAWTCWDEGAVGEMFWSFIETGHESSWNGYALTRNFSPIFLDAESITAGKGMEAIREGVEDYEYLHMLSSRATELDQSSNLSDALQDELAAAEILVDLNHGSGRAGALVLPQPPQNDTFRPLFWSTTKNRTWADTVRGQVLDLLEAL